MGRRWILQERSNTNFMTLGSHQEFSFNRWEVAYCFVSLCRVFFSSLGAHLSGWTIISKIKKNAKLSCNMITLRYVTLSRGVQDRTLFLIAVTAEYWFLCSFFFSFVTWCLFVYCWRCQFRAIHRSLIVKRNCCYFSRCEWNESVLFNFPVIFNPSMS